MTTTEPRLTGKLLIDTSMGNFLGEKRICLLEAIDKFGSISQAAKAVPMSYKSAWDAIDEMNNVSHDPLVLRSTGGRHGGGTALTPFGRRLIAFYRALEQESQLALERLSQNLEKSGVPDAASYRMALKRMSMKTSARNHFAGPVLQMRDSPIEVEVTIGLGHGLELSAIVSRESAETLELQLGREVSAFVKSSSIILIVDSKGQVSARNRFQGVVSNIHVGPVTSEVSIALPGGHHVITSVITDDSVKRLGLVVGGTVTAAFKASSVFLIATD